MALNMDAALTIRAKATGTESVQKLQQTLKGTSQAAGQAGTQLAGAGAGAQKGVAGFSALKGAAGALGAYLTAGVVINGIKSTMDAFAEFEKDSLALEAGLKNRGDAYVAQFERLQRAADELGELTLFNNDDFRKGFAQLTTFSDIAVGDYERLGIAAANIAQANNTDVSASFLQLAKAINDPVQNLSALSRSGIQFTEEQKNMIKALVEGGQKAEAQRLIFEELERQYEGIAAGAAQGAAGAFDSWGESVNQLQRSLGPFIMDVLVPLTERATALAKVLANDVVPAIESLPGPVQEAIAQLDPLRGLTVLLEGDLQKLGQIDIGATIRSWGEDVSQAASQIVDGVGSVITGTMDRVRSVLDALTSGVRGGLEALLSWIRSALQGAIRGANAAIGTLNRLPGINVPTIPLPQFGTGGVVDRPTVALVGERREREYIVPESRMAAASSAYLAGARGQAVLSGATTAAPSSPPVVNIQTGPVREMGGERFVTLQDLESAAQQIVAQVYGSMRSGTGRRALGLR